MCPIHESQDLAYVGQHDLQIKAINKVKYLSINEIHQLSKMSCLKHMYTFKELPDKYCYRYYVSKYLLPCAVYSQICVSSDKRSFIHMKTVLSHICQILRLMDKIPLYYIMVTGSEHVGLPNAPFNPPELCIERRTLALHSSVITIGLYGTTYDWGYADLI